MPERKRDINERRPRDRNRSGQEPQLDIIAADKLKCEKNTHKDKHNAYRKQKVQY